MCGHCDQSHLAVLPRDSLCSLDKYNHVSLENNIACNPEGKLCLASLLRKSQWESDLPAPRHQELAKGQAYARANMLSRWLRSVLHGQRSCAQGRSLEINK